MGFDAGVIIRAGSAGLFVLIGLIIPFVGRWTRKAVALGAMLVFYGLVLVINNIGAFGTVPDAYIVASLYVGTGVLAVLVGVSAPSPMERQQWPVLGFGALVGVAFIVGIFGNGFSIDGMAVSLGLKGFPAPVLPIVLAAIFAEICLAGMVATISARMAMSPPANRAGWIRYVGVVGLLGFYGVFAAPMNFKDPTNVWSLASALAAVLGLTMPWLVAAARTGKRLPLLVGLAWPALGLFAYAYLLLPANSAIETRDAFGMNGIMRILGWALFVYAILRADLLGVPLPRIAVRRGAVAAGALATLFIVAQIAQNFFSAQYGLLTGGIIAGAFLFAASPLQRAMERLGERKSAPTGRQADGAEKLYRDALRFALQDGAVTTEEDLHLSDLGERLGISARRAREMRLDVEHQNGVR